MKKVIIVHGWDGSPKEKIHQWLKKELENRDFEVVIPEMPNPGEPKIEAWVRKLNEVSNPDLETYFVGHSIGCQAVLRYLETLDENIKIAGVTLLAPWMHLDKQTLEEEGQEVVEIAKPWMEIPIDFKKVKSHSDNFTAIFSDNDPYVPTLEKDIFEKELKAKIIVENNKGHFNESDGVVSVESVLQTIIK